MPTGTWRVFWLRFASLFRTGKWETELDDEVRLRLEMLAAEYRRRGMSLEEARCAARSEAWNR